MAVAFRLGSPGFARMLATAWTGAASRATRHATLTFAVAPLPLQRVSNAMIAAERAVTSNSSGGVGDVVRRGLTELFNAGLWLIKRTFQPSLIRRKRKHGFLARTADKDGIRVLNRRRAKGRRKLCA